MALIGLIIERIFCQHRIGGIKIDAIDRDFPVAFRNRGSKCQRMIPATYLTLVSTVIFYCGVGFVRSSDLGFVVEGLINGSRHHCEKYNDSNDRTNNRDDQSSDTLTALLILQN